MELQSLKFAILVTLFIGVSFSIGFLAGSLSDLLNYNTISNSIEILDFNDVINKNLYKEYLLKQVDPLNIEKSLKYLTSIPHLAGTEGDKITADYVANEWKSQELDMVQINDYDIFLDFPDDLKLNNIEIKDSSNKLEIKYEIVEKIYDSDLNYTRISKPYLAYSLNGSISSDQVYYVNFCNVSDFELLKAKNIDITDSIVLCRYGKIFRGNKIKNAYDYKAKGVLLFDDPQRSAPNGSYDKIYPNGIFLPESGVQRGSIFLREGDPLTPIYPSIESAYRIDEKDQPALPKIISQCIGYDLAKQIFSLIDTETNENKNIPIDWIGSMNVSYLFGGKLKEKRTLTINVFNKKKTSKIFNVVGIIKGSIEPDRYIMIGSHRDAWTFGSVDPSSATSVLLEISRVLMRLKNDKNWQPKRSIMFLSWSAEEFGIMGSTEWIEEFEKKLITNGVAYLNLDMAAYGNYSYQARASPLLHDIIYDVTRSINIKEKETVFERWLKNDPDESNDLPMISPHVGAGSDHVSFIQRIGIPCIDQKFVFKKKDPLLKNVIGSYPLYHTSYETFKLYSNFIDPNFKVSSIMAQIISELARNLSSSLILPFNCLTYAEQLKMEFDRFKSKYKTTLVSINVSIDSLESAINNFSIVVQQFKNRLDNLDQSKFYLVRQYNDQLKNLESAFIDYSNLNKNSYLHTIFAPSEFDKYSGYSFPSLVDSINQLDESLNSINQIKYKLSIIIYRIQSASSILKEPVDFKRY